MNKEYIYFETYDTNTKQVVHSRIIGTREGYFASRESYLLQMAAQFNSLQEKRNSPLRQKVSLL